MADPDAPFALANTLGGFFSWEPRPTGPSWRPLADLLGPAVLQAHLDRARAGLASRFAVPTERVEARVVGSLVQLALTARLVSPALAEMTAAGIVPRLVLDDIRWQPTAASPVPMGGPVGASDAVGQGPAVLAAGFSTHVIDGVVQPLSQAVHASTGVSRQVLDGNVWSAVVGAVGQLLRSRPELALRGRDIVDAVLADRSDAGAVDAATGRYRRSTCCLYYRLPGGGLCGDCVLTNRPSTAW